MSDWIIPPQPQPYLPITGSNKKFPVNRIFCIGRNYVSHSEEMRAMLPQFGGTGREPPFYFMKSSNCIIYTSENNVENIPYPPHSTNLHYECEMVICIGQGGRCIDSSSALDHVLGYAVGVDLTARDLQNNSKELRRPWESSKSFDFSAPCSSIKLVDHIPSTNANTTTDTPSHSTTNTTNNTTSNNTTSSSNSNDEETFRNDPRNKMSGNRKMELYVQTNTIHDKDTKSESKDDVEGTSDSTSSNSKGKGELKQSSSLDLMIWCVPEIISKISHDIELKAGDIIFTGTPAGVGALSIGDSVYATIEGVGVCAFHMIPPLDKDSEGISPGQSILPSLNKNDILLNSFNINTSIQCVLNTIDKDMIHTKPRLYQLITSLIIYIHSYIKYNQINMNEWECFIDYITKTGQLCNEKRQEWILISDILGITSLVDCIQHSVNRNEDYVYTPTESTVLGPFFSTHPSYSLGMNICLDHIGTCCTYEGHVYDVYGNPLEGVCMDVWLTSPNGEYVVQSTTQPQYNNTGQFHTNNNGEYYFIGIIPTSYSVPTDGTGGVLLNTLGRRAMRPAHIHFMLRKEGYETLITHLFVDKDPYINEDAVFAVKDTLVYSFPLYDTIQPNDHDKEIFSLPYSKCQYNFVMKQN